MSVKFYEHQKENIDFKINNPRSFDTSTCGTGKTLSTLEACQQRNSGKLLTIAPKSTLEAVWYNDAKKLNPHANVGWFDRNEQRKDPRYINKLLNHNDIVSINIEAVDLVQERCQQELQHYTDLVIDEFTSIKNRTTQRSKSTLHFSESFDNIHLLSGTPTPNGILDIWHPAFLLDGGKRLGANFFAFRNIVCQPILKGNALRQFTEWKEIPGAIEEVGEILRDITIRHVLEDVIDMPERVMVDRIITMPDKLRKQYDKMKQDAILQLKGGPKGIAKSVFNEMMKHTGISSDHLDMDEIVAVNKAVLGNKLLQIASGSAYLEAGGSRLLDTNKYELIVDEVMQRDASLVFFLWQHQRNALTNILKQKKINFGVIDGNTTARQRADTIQNFEHGMYRTVLLQPAAAAHGITLTRSTASIWCSPTFNLEHFLQANHRDYRIGQTKRSEVIMVQYRDTIEQEVYRRLQQKNTNLTDLLNILQS